MASVRKLKKDDPKSPWVCEYTDAAGVRRRITPKTGLKKDADAARRRIEAELERGEHVAVSQTATMETLVDDYLKDCERRWRAKDNMAGTTLHTYQNVCLKHIRPHFGKTKLTALDHVILQDFINTKSQEFAFETMKTIAMLMRQLMKYAVYKRWLTIDPLTVKNIRVPGSGQVERAIPSKTEIGQILQALMEKDRYEHHHAYKMRIAVMMLAIFGGLRRGEICGLQWENVDLARDQIVIRHSYSIYDGLKEPKSRAGNRTIPLVPQLAAFLKMMKDEEGHNPTGHVLKSRGGERINPGGMWFIYRKVMEKAGLVDEKGSPKYPFHTLRHSNISLLVSMGLPALHIQRLAGHGSYKMTMDRYAHLFPEDQSSRAALTNVASQFEAMRSLPLLSRPEPAQSPAIEEAVVPPTR